MSPYELKARIKRDPEAEEQIAGPEAPGAVVCLALYQVVKAAVFLLIFLQIWAQHEAESSAGNSTYDPLLLQPGFFLFPLVSAMFVLIGWGIWKLQGWARVAQVVLFLALGIYWWRIGTQDLSLPLVYKEPTIVTAVLLVELTSLAALFLLENVTDAFDRAKKTGLA
ncbi:MAG TPA: hypothetical protein VK716_04250 [Terracidiphilus sp.]|jgi:hypothetical protein|nr:hypothetical protein [Terracidiphilus sp.]